MPNIPLDKFLETPLEELLREAGRVRDEHFGNSIEFCAIINAKSGRCPMNCRFCAQSIHYATEIESYPLLDTETLVTKTQNQWNRGIHRIGWVAGGTTISDDEVAKVATTARQCCGGRLCASLGRLDRNALQSLKNAGVTRYHHNLETSESFYPTICDTQKWSDRLATVERVKSLGMEICCGGLFGLGESWKDRYDLAMVLRKLDVDSIPINFLHPIPGTPLADSPILPVEEALRITAMFRICVPQATIRGCGGRPSVFGNRHAEILRSGINAIMTGDYLTTSGITPENDLQMIRQHGFQTALNVST